MKFKFNKTKQANIQLESGFEKFFLNKRFKNRLKIDFYDYNRLNRINCSIKIKNRLNRFYNRNHNC